MKVAIFSFDFDCTFGTGNMTYELCHEFAKKAVDFVLFLPKVEKNRSSFKGDYPFETRYILPPQITSLKDRHFWEYFKVINLSGFTLVHSLFEFPHCFMAAFCAKRNKLPFIMGAQGTYGVLPLTQWPNKYFLKWSYDQAKEIIVPSQFTKEKIREYAKKDYRISVIHNGVNFSRFDSKPDFENLKDKYKNHKILLTVGALIPRKGQDLVIKALPKIKERYPEIKYLLVGDGRMRQAWEKLADDLGLSEQVEFLGKVAADELVKYFHLGDIYVHTPRVINLSFEGFGLVYLEASACAKPIVATDAGGIRDAVIDNQTGLIVADGDIDGISDKVIYLLDHDDLKKQLGENGREYAKKHDWPIIANEFIDHYQKYSL